VNEAVFAWDDGQESNVYVGTNDLERTRVKFGGEAKISDGWSAGYLLEIGVRGANSSAFDQNNTASVNALDIRHSYWFLKSKDLGSVRVGQTGTATYHLLDDADAANTRNYSDAEAASVAVNNFFLVVNGVRQGIRWTDVLGGFNNNTPGQSGRRNVVRYDTPEFAGFTFTAAWGEDDMWDTALTFKKDIADFKVIAKLGYGESTSPTNPGSCSVQLGMVTHRECNWWGSGATVMHSPTGIYVYGGYGEHEDELAVTRQAGAEDTSSTWFVQAGVEQKWTHLGKTTVFGEYRNDEVGTPETARKLTGAAAGAAGNIHDSDIDFWAAGVVQNIDAAAMDLYVIYRHAEGDVTTFGNVTTALDDFDMVITGARIQF
jgi:predicted porin